MRNLVSAGPRTTRPYIHGQPAEKFLDPELDLPVGSVYGGEVGFFGEPCAVAPDAKVNFNARYAEPCAVAPDARVNFNARHAEPCAVAPDANVNFGVVIIQGLAEETCYR
jgi:hypothetical protein